MEAVCGRATLGKDNPADNQDDCCTVSGGKGLWTFAVADGLGSHPHSQEAASAAMEAIILAVRAGKLDEWDIYQLIDETRRTVVKYAQIFYGERGQPVPDSGEYSTTLILGVERSDSLMFAWLGNGAILHIHGSALLGTDSKPVPWQSANLMRPHIVENAEGKDALNKYLTGSAESQDFVPSMIEISLDNDGDGDVFVLCTDGILSAEDKKIGRVSNGGYWLQIDEMEIQLYALLHAITAAPGDITSDLIAAQATSYLAGLRSAGLQHDDSTVVIFFSGRFLEARQRRIAEQQPKDASVPSGWANPWQR